MAHTGVTSRLQTHCSSPCNQNKSIRLSCKSQLVRTTSGRLNRQRYRSKHTLSHYHARAIPPQARVTVATPAHLLQLLPTCCRRVLCKPVASTGDGSPPLPPSGGAGDGKGDGDSQDGRPTTKNVLLKGWEDRIAADPQFTYKVFVEQVYADQ